MRRFFLPTLLIFIGISQTSCNYHFGYGDLSERYSTISIPYVEDDDDGQLTKEIIHAMSTSGAFKYTPYQGELTLKIKLLDWYDENIGFHYDRKKSGKLKNGLIPTETRLYAVVEVLLIETATDKILRGPTLIKTSVDFDHDYYSNRNEINVFSLGQLNDIDEAQEAASRPLYRRIAIKISDYIINSW